MEKNLIPALIDGKDVTTDWLESIFDSDAVWDFHMMVGFINHSCVTCKYEKNVITWEVHRDMGRSSDDLYSYMLLEERLKAAESEEQNIYSMIQHGELGKLQIVQSFFFKNDSL